uniref:Uncharacterized protein n=1 Tax=viral metagenome TaxID=1070528 RepID=A0A6M3LHZ9_9ZZZZ
MDTSAENIKKCEKAEEIQAIYFNSLDEHLKLLPSFIFDKRTRRVSIEIWAPPTLQAELNITGHSVVISIERDRPLGINFQKKTRTGLKVVSGSPGRINYKR